MRDIVFLIGFALLAVFAIRRPFIGVSLWLWSGLFVPVHWLYGIAQSISYNTVFAATTLFGYLIYRYKPHLKPDSLFILPLLLLIHTTITTVLTVGVPVIAWISWENFLKVFLIYLFTILIIRKQVHFNYFIWCIVLSIGFLGFVEGLKFIASGGGHRISGPMGHILADNNHMAVALCMTLPLIVYLITVTPQKYLRLGLIGMVAVCALAILGTHSRGGFLGLAVVGGYFWFKSQKKMLSLILIMIVASIGYQFLPDRWFDRMNSIETAMEDSSFTNRVNSWKIHTQMAIERPLIGGGFKAPQFGYIWNDLKQSIGKFDFIPTPPPGDRGWAAHSIYFQVLGDHGFVGLFLFLSIILATFVKLTSVERHFTKRGERDQWQFTLARMTKVSLIAYCLAGAALSLAYVELFYAIVSIAYCLSVTVAQSVEKEKRIKPQERSRNVAVQS